MRTPIQSTIGRFLRAGEGGVAIIFALALVPVLGMAGAAVDYSQLTNDRAGLQRVADAAALAAAMEFGKDEGDPTRVVNEHARRLSAARRDLTITSVNYTRSEDRHIVVLEALRDNAFGSFTLLQSRIVARADVVAESPGRAAQISIVMDVTNSMGGSNWASATETITSFLQEMRSRDRERFRVSFVPFSDRVRINELPGMTAWIDGHRPGNWNGCVEPIERSIGDFDFAVDATLPGEGGRLFSVSHQSTIAQGRGAIGRRAHHGVPTCPNVSAVAPTNDIEIVAQTVDRARPSGTGRFDEGLVWGWRMLSPAWMDAMGVTPPYIDEEEIDRIVIYITDGNATIYEIEVGGRDGGHYGWNNGSPLAFQHLVDLCERMRADGIRIVMIQQPGNHHFNPYARACAHSEEDYHRVNGTAELKLALDAIAKTAQRLRIAS
ncbi:MAG: hypothetical protein EA385_06760 [Salinarimonadaceae bacterium]|nr:MAG: hypothetical protein EA385_06760 [Salinarimonadaceae bacterium]